MFKRFYLVLSFFAVALGVAGIFLPVLPTTPFLLLAAFGFGKSSPRCHRWLTGNEYLNSYLENYRSGIGVPRRIIFNTLVFLWLGLGVSALLTASIPGGVLLAAIGVAVSLHLLRLKRSTRQPSRFTLLELLVSMGIIALLAAILLPALSRARNAAQTTACVANLKQIGLALELYTDDHAGYIPDMYMGYQHASIPIIRMSMRGKRELFALGKLVGVYGVTAASFGCPFNSGRDPGFVTAAWAGSSTVQTAYIYRETDVNFQPVKADEENFGKALLMDFICQSATGEPIVGHEYQSVNILYEDSHVETRRNTPTVGERYTTATTASSGVIPPCAYIWEHADTAE